MPIAHSLAPNASAAVVTSDDSQGKDTNCWSGKCNLDVLIATFHSEDCCDHNVGVIFEFKMSCTVLKMRSESLAFDDPQASS